MVKTLFLITKNSLSIFTNESGSYVPYKYRGTEAIKDYEQELNDVQDYLEDEFKGEELFYSFIYDKMCDELEEFIEELDEEVVNCYNSSDFNSQLSEIPSLIKKLYAKFGEISEEQTERENELEGKLLLLKEKLAGKDVELLKCEESIKVLNTVKTKYKNIVDNASILNKRELITSPVIEQLLNIPYHNIDEYLSIDYYQYNVTRYKIFIKDGSKIKKNKEIIGLYDMYDLEKESSILSKSNGMVFLLDKPEQSIFGAIYHPDDNIEEVKKWIKSKINKLMLLNCFYYKHYGNEFLLDFSFEAELLEN